MLTHPTFLVVLAWVKAHRGIPFLWSTGLSSALVALSSRALLPGPEGGTYVPVWALAPGFFAALAATTAVDQLSEFCRLHQKRVGAVRAAWGLVVALIAGAADLPTAMIIGKQWTCVATIYLVGGSFAGALWLGGAASLIGSAYAIAVLLMYSTESGFPLEGDLSQLSQLGVIIGGGGVFLASLLLYGIRGARKIVLVNHDEPT